ncbi:hypothetical protein DFJ73DRAFT_293557 [Zopfochytrium polystomum]|nr:hypothetical protein DFJ73DRAFT_293557 [Zopfochytrium polystomum]
MSDLLLSNPSWLCRSLDRVRTLTFRRHRGNKPSAGARTPFVQDRMKFDPHRAKASRRWKARHQSEGAKNTPSSTSSVDSTATHDNDLDHDSGSDSETRRFGRRKLESNAFRFVDEKIDDNDATVSDSATMAENDSKRADRETRNLIALIRDAERELIVDPSSYFRFKGEQDWTLDSKASLQADLLSEDVSKLWALDFAGLDEALATLPLSDRFALAENELVYAIILL